MAANLQGGATLHNLHGKGFTLRALANHGVEVVQGDLNNAASLKQALTGVWGVYAVQNTWEAGVEDTVRSLGFASTVILRPVFFMENLLSPWFLNGDKLVSAMALETRLQMIAVEDIGTFGALAFTRAVELNGRELDLAADAVTLPEAAATIGRELGRPLEYLQIPISDVRKNSEDFALMLEWFDRMGYDADIAGLEQEFGVKMLSLEAWARKQA